MEPVIPYEFNEDLRSLPYYALPSSANKPRPYRPLLRPPFVRKARPTLLAPSLPSAPYLPSAPAPATFLDFAGITFTDTCINDGVIVAQCGAGWPPDPNGDVGPNHYIQAVNDAYAIYDKTGALLTSFTENFLWSHSSSNPCNGNSGGDTIVVYDPLGDRWILTNLAFAFSGSNPVPPFYECIAVSQTNDPVSGGWFLYPIRMDPGGTNKPPTGTLNDYPKFGIWPDCLYMSANGFDTSDNFVGTMFASFSRSDLEQGISLTSSNSSLGFINNATDPFTMIPSNILGASPGSLPPPGTPNYFVSESQTSFEFEVRKFTPAANCGAGGTLSVPTNVAQTSYNFPDTGSPNFSTNIIPQPNTAIQLDSLGDRLMQKVQYRRIGSAESLWIVHTVRTGDTSSTTGSQWAQIDVSGGTIATSPVQQEIYAPDTTLYRWMGSLAVDKDGNMALGYSTSNATAPNYPSIAYSGRLASDPFNQLPQTETVLFSGTGSQTNNCGGAPCDRWGDYSSMSVDPSDDCTFWYVNEYYDSQANGNIGNWHTQIGAFRFSDACNPDQLVEEVNGPSFYPDIATAYAAITGDDALDIQQITFYQNLTLDNDFYVILNGGYNSSFLPFTGFSAVHGTVAIGGTATGTVEFNGISIQ